MAKLLVLGVLIVLVSFSSAVHKWNNEDGPNSLTSKEPRVEKISQNTVPKIEKISQEEADGYMMDIFFKLQDKDSNLTAIIQELDTVLRLAPNMPKNINLTLMLSQMEQVVRKNITNLLKENIKMKNWNKPDYTSVGRYDNSVGRYKRSNETYQNCITVCNAIGTFGGGSIGASILGTLLSIIPGIGTAIGALLGARLGSALGVQLSNAIATAWCPK